MSTSIGRLRERVTLLKPTRAEGSYGDDTTITWSDFADTWAAFTPGLGDDVWTGDMQTALLACAFVIRYRPEVTASWRLRWDGRAYDIETVARDQQKPEFLRLTCVERQAVD